MRKPRRSRGSDEVVYVESLEKLGMCGKEPNVLERIQWQLGQGQPRKSEMHVRNRESLCIGCYIFLKCGYSNIPHTRARLIHQSQLQSVCHSTSLSATIAEHKYSDPAIYIGCGPPPSGSMCFLQCFKQISIMKFFNPEDSSTPKFFARRFRPIIIIPELIVISPTPVTTPIVAETHQEHVDWTRLTPPNRRKLKDEQA